ncbi:MAG: hypothetical protein JJV98_01765 [Desulfosarcina sp.]|nr:hypothetical protein [Desulfobacterales bacterium]
MAATESYPWQDTASAEKALIDIATLRGRGLAPPFSLRLSGAGPDNLLVCTAILRHLPGKRLVCRASRRHGQAVIAKIFLDPRQARRHLQREINGLTALKAVQLPTPEVLFRGTLDDGQTPLLLLTAIPDAGSLADRWAGLNKTQRGAHLNRCIELLAQLHAGGWRQRDIHPGNFLVAGSAIYLVDGDDVRTLGPGPFGAERQCLANLALFLVQFDPDSDRLVGTALETYCRQRGWTDGPRRRQRLERMMRHCRYKRMRHFAAKVARPCTAVTVRQVWRRYTACDRNWYSAEILPLLSDPDRYMEKGDLIKTGNSATVAQITFQGRVLVVKRYNIKNFRHRLRRCLRPSRGMLAWRSAHMLRLIGIPTARPLALIEERWGPLRSRAFLICAHQPGSRLADYWKTDWEAQDPRTEALESLSVLLRRLAGAQISHGDKKATNLIFDGRAIALVDLDGLRVCRSVRSFKRHFRKDCRRLLQNWHRHPNIFHDLRQMLNDPGITGTD